jgi:hypothetical protein
MQAATEDANDKSPNAVASSPSIVQHDPARGSFVNHIKEGIDGIMSRKHKDTADQAMVTIRRLLLHLVAAQIQCLIGAETSSQYVEWGIPHSLLLICQCIG